MAKRLMAIPLALALALGAQATAFAQTNMMQTGDSVRIADVDGRIARVERYPR